MWQTYLLDYVIVGVVVFVVGALAHRLSDPKFVPHEGWIVCFIAVVIFWPISAFGIMRAIFTFIRAMWRKHA